VQKKRRENKIKGGRKEECKCTHASHKLTKSVKVSKKESIIDRKEKGSGGKPNEGKKCSWKTLR